MWHRSRILYLLQDIKIICSKGTAVLLNGLIFLMVESHQQESAHNLKSRLLVFLASCANFGLLNAKQEKVALISWICHKLTILLLFLTHVSAQKLQSEHFDCANKFTFRKSAADLLICSLLHYGTRLPLGRQWIQCCWHSPPKLRSFCKSVGVGPTFTWSNEAWSKVWSIFNIQPTPV